MTPGRATRPTGDDYSARAGALALYWIANPEQPQPAMPEEERVFVADLLESWLGECPQGPLSLGPESEPAMAALLGGWCSTVVHALALQPRTVAETAEATRAPVLAGAPGERIEGVVAKRIEEMEAAGLLAARQDEDGERRYAPTEWLRLAIGPLAAAARLEMSLPHGEPAPIVPLDVEAAFLLTLPLVGLPEELWGSCRLTVSIREPRHALAGVVLLVEAGEIVSLTPSLRMDSSNFAYGAPSDWIDTLIDPSVAALGYGGDPQFVFGLLDGLHEKLFRIPVS